jgi:hypothetical protein
MAFQNVKKIQRPFKMTNFLLTGLFIAITNFAIVSPSSVCLNTLFLLKKHFAGTSDLFKFTVIEAV